MKGRKPNPIQKQIAEGDPRDRGVHKLDARLEAIPKAARGLPDPPRHLSAAARAQWAIWKEDLEIMEMDFRADAVVLEGACVCYARAVEAERALERDGSEVEESIVDRSTGEVIGTRIKNHPAVARQNLYWKQVHAFCSSLGLTLVARQRLAVDSQDTTQNDLLSQLLTTPRELRSDPVEKKILQ